MDDEFQVFLDVYRPVGECRARGATTAPQMIYLDIERLVGMARLWKQAAIASDNDARVATAALTDVNERLDRIHAELDTECLYDCAG